MTRTDNHNRQEGKFLGDGTRQAGWRECDVANNGWMVSKPRTRDEWLGCRPGNIHELEL
jgi:hypothetical protein